MPAVKLLKNAALAAEVFLVGYGNLETGLVMKSSHRTAAEGSGQKPR
jgi:hypothetical protein